MNLPRWSAGHHINKDHKGSDYEIWYILEDLTGKSILGTFTGTEDSTLIKETVKAHNAIIDSYGTMAVRAFDALRMLVMAKDMSDATGKTPEYLALKELAWKTARDIIANGKP